VLARQRERWHRGLIGTIIAHRDAVGNRRYGRFGVVAMPFLLVGEMLAPVIELAGYAITIFGFAFGLLDWQFAGLFFVVAFGFGIVLSCLGILLDELSFRSYSRWSDLARLFMYAVIESLGFRQLTVWFRLRAFWQWFQGSDSWGVMQREGFSRSKPSQRLAA
jgi:hypothetical protein